MRFTKMHGCGNDYVYVDGSKEKVRNASKVAVAVSDRHMGIGSDGLIIIHPSKKADFRMEMYNLDGSEGNMCGNGIRCIGKYVFDHGLTKKKTLTIETKGGLVGLDLHVKGGKVERVTVAMGAPRPIPKEFHVLADGKKRTFTASVHVIDRMFEGTVVSMGNPHFVVEVDDPAAFPVERYGPAIETHVNFPSRVNVEFVKVLAKGHVTQRTWERGSGETWACGSGACAVAVALNAGGRTGRDVAIDLRGGRLAIALKEKDAVFMTGPAVEVFSGEWPTTPGDGR